MSARRSTATTPTTNPQLLRAEHDRQIRGRIAERLPSDWSADPDGPILRVLTPHSGMIFSDGLARLSNEEVDRAVERAVAFLAGSAGPMEWKLYDTDHPRLVKALTEAGFSPQDTERVLIGPVTALVDAGPVPARVQLRRVTSRPDLQRVADLESQVWGEDWSWLADDLMTRLQDRPEDHQVWVAEADPAEPAGLTRSSQASAPGQRGEMISAGWLVRLPGTQFAGLWGGSTLQSWRGRGVYRSLVARRAVEAGRLGVDYLWVDASADSSPILRRLGMVEVGTTTPWVRPPR